MIGANKPSYVNLYASCSLLCFNASNLTPNSFITSSTSWAIIPYSFVDPDNVPSF
jgi:hypothetical protein